MEWIWSRLFGNDKKPPQLSFKLKKVCDVVTSTKEWGDVHLPIDILLLTVESCDFLSCYSLLGEPFRSYKEELGYVYFGCMGEAGDGEKLWVALMTSSEGAATPGGSLAVGQIAFRVLRPKAVFSVGTCISLDSEKVRRGDVVISSKLTTAEGFKVPVSPLLGCLVKDTPYGWAPPLENPDESEVNIHPNSDILSLSLTLKRQYDDICKEYPGAVAIETEGKGVYAAAYDTNIEWVIVKGVASYFHQSQAATSEWMSFASSMAASVVAKMLIDPRVFRKWRHYNQGSLVTETTTLTDQAVVAVNAGEQGPNSISEAVFHSDVSTVQQHIVGDVVSSGRENADSDISRVMELLEKEYKRRAKFRPLLWSKGTKLQLKKVYTKLRVVSKGEAEGSEIEVDDIFGSSEEDNDPLVLVEGSPGIGKTTFCLKLAHDWANGAMPRNFPSFKLVFLLKCRDMKGDIVEDIFEQLLPDDLKEKEVLVNFLGDLNNQKQILIILDGLDELPEKLEDRVNKVLGRKKFSLCYVLATTRQEKGIHTREQFQFDTCLAIEGFSKEDSFEYIRKHFRNIGTEHSSKGERLIEEIKQNPLLGELQSNPLNLLLLCVVYEDHEGSLPSSITELYQTIVRCLLRRYCVKEELKASEKDEDLDKQFEIAILALGELAWKCLLNDRLSFYEDELEELERSNENIVNRKLGLIYKEESLKRLKPRHTYSFLHKTFQEYLAASYIAHKLLASAFHVPEQVKLFEVIFKFRKVFLFVCGILREEASILFKQIGDTLQKDWDWSKCSDVQASFFSEICKESGNAERMANTLCSFLPFPRVLHVSQRFHEGVINVLEACARFSKVQTPAEVHVAIPPGLQVVKNIQHVLAGVPDVKTLILPAVSYSIDRTEVDEVLRASKTLEKVSFTLSAVRGEGCASALDVGLGADSSLSSVGLRIYGVLNHSALQAVENLLLNKCLPSLSIAVYGDVQESLVKALAGGLAGKSTVNFLDLCVKGNLSFDGAYLLEKGILSNGSLTNLKISVNGELPVNWQGVGANLHAKLAEKGVVSSIYPNTFSKVKGSQVTSLNRMLLSKTHLVQQNVTLNVWGDLSGDGSKAVSEVLLHTPVSHLTLNIHGQLTDAILRCTARCVKEQEKPSSITINSWVEMTEKEKNLINELGLDKNPSVSLNVCGTDAPLKESSDSEVISSEEPSSLSDFFAKPGIVSSKSLSLTINIMPGTSRLWINELRRALKKVTSLNSLTLAINIYVKPHSIWPFQLGGALAESTSLYSLTLAINIYIETGSVWPYQLGKALARSTSLNSLTLAINNYSDSDSDSLSELEKIKSLTEYNFTFNICGK
ncbi:uncharacterized protein [Acropora muricata]|uniref:uncharacterized protein isoform X2 n=1 Tax=Acropora muricata TaxID=159855 RepID=UPI0034E536AD